MFIFSRGQPNLPDEFAVARMLGLNSLAPLYAWGQAHGFWSPDLVLTDDERNFILKHRELAKEESTAG